MFDLLKKRNRNSNSVWGLTPKGKRKIEEALDREGASYQIMEFISDNGSSNTSEIANGLQVNARRLERKLEIMERQGDIMRVGSGED